MILIRFLHKNKTVKGFTLAELLIALAILGVIATFTIPKILDSGSDGKRSAIAKEAISVLSGAFQAYKAQNSVSASTSKQDIAPYINYVADRTDFFIDNHPAIGGTYNCPSAATSCLMLHSGAVIGYTKSITFQDTSATSALNFVVDPDGPTNGVADSIQVVLYANGRITTRDVVLPNSYVNGGLSNPDPTYEAAWFSWSN